MAAAEDHFVALIARARDRTSALADRHEAFGELVRRFQDLAIASAYARLRDRALAEDAAQDAFLTAWERLDQLRQPEAFPGWILRLVFTQCNRRLRCARLSIVPEGEAGAVAAAPQSPEIDRTENSRLLQRALSGLTSSDRLVLSLFYGAERSQKDIADWLGVPVTTIARRLAHAKRRLQRTAFAILSGNLRADRRHAGERFAVELSVRLRRADRDDALDAANLGSGLQSQRAHRSTASALTCAYVVEDPERHAPIAYAAAAPTIFKPIYELQLAIGDEAILRHAADALLIQVIEELQSKRAIAVRHRTSSGRAAVVSFLLSRKFQIVRRSQDWRLNTPAHPGLGANPDWKFRSLATVINEPGLFDQALELATSALEEDAAARSFLPIHPDAFRRVLRAQTDGVIAVTAGKVRGMIGGSADDTVANGCRIELLAVERHARRQGMATALLHRLLADRRASSARILAPDRRDFTGWLTRCGFVHVTDALLLERLLRKTVRVAPEQLDEYVGRYVSERPGVEPITIERCGDFLISKARDMRDVLLASSDREFFTRHHYAEGRFECDDSGRVARVVITEGGHEIVASRSFPIAP
jgi:RNA polymerase sigma factor (sigma-70 family)